MDVTALALHHATCCINESQHERFDSVFQHYVVGDEGGFYCKALDLVVGNGTIPPVAVESSMECCSQPSITMKMMTE